YNADSEFIWPAASIGVKSPPRALIAWLRCEVPLPRCDHGLGEPQGPGLAAIEHDGHGVLRRSAGGGECSIRPDNTDQGSQFTSFSFTNTLKDAGTRISMDGRGRWMD